MVYQHSWNCHLYQTIHKKMFVGEGRTSQIYQNRFAIRKVLFLCFVVSGFAMMMPSLTQAQSDEIPRLRVFIFAGQSNMVGTHSRVEHIRRFPPFADLDKPQANILFSYKLGREQMATSDGWIDLQPTGDYFGPELSFGKRVSQKIDAPIAIIKCASGGTSLGEDWNPEKPGGFKLYPLALEHIRTSLAELDRRKIPYQLEGFMWHQGENDMFNKDWKPIYGDNLKNFIARWRVDLKAPELRFYIGELCTKTIWGMDNRDNMLAIRTAQKAVADSDPLVDYIPTSHDAVEIGGDEGLHYHYGTLGQLEHGVNYAEAYLRTIGKETLVERTLEQWPYAKGSPVKLFILAGHRNMEGERAFSQELKASEGYESLGEANPRVAFQYSLGGGFKKSKGWEPLGPAGPYDTFGPELSFVSTLQSAGSSNIAVAKFTHSGSQMNDWTPEGTRAKDLHLYKSLIRFIRSSIRELEEKGHTVEIAGIFYHVGENEMAFAPYRREAAKWLQSTIAQSRIDLSLPNLRWYISQQPPPDQKGLNTIDITANLAAIAAKDPATIHLKAFDLPPQNEKLVLDAAGILQLGKLLAKSYLEQSAFIASPASQDVDLILHHGKIVTVDDQFSIAQAMAVSGDRIVAVGSDETILSHKGPNTKLVDLAGKMVLPGLIDSHVHAPDAAVYEFDHVVPEMDTIGDILSYLRSRAQIVPEGEWISVSQVFVTRLKEPRFPTRMELDQVAPKHPVAFRTGPDAALNSLALERSGIGEDFQITDGEPGHLERDSQSGKLNGILRSCSRLIKSKPSGKSPTKEERADALKRMLQDYNRVGLTSISDRNASDSGIELYQTLLSKNELTCRVYLYYGINAQDSIESLEEKIPTIRKKPLHEYNSMLWLRGVKIFLDGGMLTGSAYMRQPWGKSEIYSITDPEYRGLLYVPEEKLYRIAKAVIANDLQMTAHSVGDGAIHTLIDAYARVDQEMSLEGKRPCITHCNFLSLEAIESMKKLGLVADLQPAWLWLDGQTLRKQFGDERTRYFQPYRELIDQGVVVGGGSDHMQKVGSFRAVNPYNPFLGMWIAVQRMPRRTDQAFHPEQKIGREEAIRLYTINNAYLTFEEKRKGSIEADKLADFIILDRDILTCPIDDLRSTEVLSTYLGGKLVFQK